jgi:hypothetical protein
MRDSVRRCLSTALCQRNGGAFLRTEHATDCQARQPGVSRNTPSPEALSACSPAASPATCSSRTRASSTAQSVGSAPATAGAAAAAAESPAPGGGLAAAATDGRHASDALRTAAGVCPADAARAAAPACSSFCCGCCCCCCCWAGPAAPQLSGLALGRADAPPLPPSLPNCRWSARSRASQEESTLASRGRMSKLSSCEARAGLLLPLSATITASRFSLRERHMTDIQ